MSCGIYDLKAKQLKPIFSILDICHKSELDRREYWWYKLFSKEFALVNDEKGFLEYLRKNKVRPGRDTP